MPELTPEEITQAKDNVVLLDTAINGDDNVLLGTDLVKTLKRILVEATEAAETIEHETLVATAIADATAAKNAAEAAQAAAETAETNAETAETNAETAEANAVSAKDAAEAAEAATTAIVASFARASFTPVLTASDSDDGATTYKIIKGDWNGSSGTVDCHVSIVIKSLGTLSGDVLILGFNPGNGTLPNASYGEQIGHALIQNTVTPISGVRVVLDHYTNHMWTLKLVYTNDENEATPITAADLTNNTKINLHISMAAVVGVDNWSGFDTYTQATTRVMLNNLANLIEVDPNELAILFEHNGNVLEGIGLPIYAARTQLITYPNDLENVAWTLTSATIEASTDAKIGDIWILTDAATSSRHGIGLGTVFSAGTLRAVAIIAKAGTKKRMMLGMGASSSRGAIFDLSTGTVIAIAPNDTGEDTLPAREAEIYPLGDGWYLCIVYSGFASTATPRSFGVSMCNDSYNTSTTPETYLGDTTGTILIARPQAIATSLIVDLAIDANGSATTRNADVIAMSQVPEHNEILLRARTAKRLPDSGGGFVLYDFANVDEDNRLLFFWDSNSHIIGYLESDSYTASWDFGEIEPNTFFNLTITYDDSDAGVNISLNGNAMPTEDVPVLILSEYTLVEWNSIIIPPLFLN